MKKVIGDWLGRILLSLILLLMITPNVSAQTGFALFGMGILVCVALIVVFLIVAIVVGAVWMYKDANKRGMSGGLWVVILIVCTLLFSLIGFIIVIVLYLLVRHPIQAQPPPPGYYPPPPPPPR